MPKFYHLDVLDNGLSEISAGNELRLLTGYTQGDDRVAVIAASILTVALVGGDFTLANQGTLGRQNTVGAKSGVASGNSASYESGTATSGGNNTLTDTGATFLDRSNKVLLITGGLGSGQYRRITSNTGTIITVDTDWGTNPDNTSTYEILDDLHLAVIDATRVLAVTDESSNQVVSNGNTVNVPALIFKMNQPI